MKDNCEKGEHAEQLAGIEQWVPLLRLAVGDLPRYGGISGVYALRAAATGDILYIGCSNNLRRRILGNHLGGVGGETTQRVHELLFSEGQIAGVDVAWIETDRYKEKEAQLKEEHREKHGRLPIWNRL